MRISNKKREELYAAIHNSLVDVWLKLNLSAKDDVFLAQIEQVAHEIWRRQKEVLRLDVKDTTNRKYILKWKEGRKWETSVKRFRNSKEAIEHAQIIGCGSNYKIFKVK